MRQGEEQTNLIGEDAEGCRLGRPVAQVCEDVRTQRMVQDV